MANRFFDEHGADGAGRQFGRRMVAIRDNGPLWGVNGEGAAPISGRRHGLGQPHDLSAERLKRGPTRDELINANIEAINARGNQGLFSRIFDTQLNDVPRGRHAVFTENRGNSNIFGPPVLPEQPKRRLRPDFSEDQLRVLYHPVSVKTEAADAMEAHMNLVDRMTREKNKHSRKSLIRMEGDRLRMKSPTQLEHGVAGFRGMGADCGHVLLQGRCCKANDQFIISPTEPKTKSARRHEEPTGKIVGDREIGYIPGRTSIL